MRSRLARSSAVAASILLISSLAFAQSVEKAEALFLEGDKAEQSGDCASAIRKFELAAAIKETSQLRMRIGRCQTKLGLLLQANESFARAIKVASDPKLKELAEEKLRELERRIPSVEVTSSTTIPDASLLVNQKATALGQPLRLNPGSVSVELRAAGFESYEETFTLREGDKKKLVVALTPVSDAGGNGAEGTGSTFRPGPLPFVLYGVAAAGIGVGVGFLVGSFNIEAEGDRRCPDRTPDGEYICPPDFVDEWNNELRPESIRNQVISGVSFGVAGVAATIATILLATSFEPAQAQGEDAPETTVTVTPVFVPGGAYLMAVGRY